MARKVELGKVEKTGGNDQPICKQVLQHEQKSKLGSAN
jgi:hypothetical protein